MTALTRSINRMGKYVQSECLTLRRKRGDPLIDPTKAETDPKLFAQGVSAIIRVGRDVVAQRNNVSAAAQAKQARFNLGISLKLALFPLHVWLPNAYAYAPSFATIFLAATATKVAVYLFIRIAFSVFGA